MLSLEGVFRLYLLLTPSRDDSEREGDKLEMNEQQVRKEMFGGYIDEDGVDRSLWTGLDWQHVQLYATVRKELSEKYPKPKHLMEADDDTVNIVEARSDCKASLFLRALNLVHDLYDRVEILQHLATEHEKIVIRFYCHITRNWANCKKDFLKALTNTDIYELVESYFKILRKYGVSTTEEPYYFLSPKQRRKIQHDGEMLKRTTQFDDGEIRVSILEGFT